MIRIAIVAAILASIVPASADWQYTKWGMTADQAMAAANGQMKRCVPQKCAGQSIEGEAAQLFGSYTSGEFKFTAFLYFNKQTNILSKVALQLNDPGKAYSLSAALRGKYGQPTKHSEDAIISNELWRTQQDEIFLRIMGQLPSMPSLATLSYTPRLTASNKGL